MADSTSRLTKRAFGKRMRGSPPQSPLKSHAFVTEDNARVIIFAFAVIIHKMEALGVGNGKGRGL